MEKLEDIEDNGERVEAVGNINKPRTTATLVMNVNNVRVHAAKNNLRLYCIVALNASGVYSRTVAVVYEDEERFESKNPEGGKLKLKCII